MTKEQVELLITSVGNEVISSLVEQESELLKIVMISEEIGYIKVEEE
jgi:hypothetical protein